MYTLTFICRCQGGCLRLRWSGRHTRSHRRSGCSGSDWQQLARGGNGRSCQEWRAMRSNSWGVGSIMGSGGKNRRVLNRYGRLNWHRYTYSWATWGGGRVGAYSSGRNLWWASSDNTRGSCISDVTHHCSNITLNLCGDHISGDWWCVFKKKKGNKQCFSTFYYHTCRQSSLWLCYRPHSLVRATWTWTL